MVLTTKRKFNCQLTKDHPITACKRNPESFLSGHPLHAKRYGQLRRQVRIEIKNIINGRNYEIL